MVEEIIKFINGATNLISKAVDAGTNAYRSKLKEAVNLLNRAYAEIERLTKVCNDYSEHIKALKIEIKVLEKMIRNLQEEKK